MAEINVQRKRTSAWLWLLGIVGLALAAWLVTTLLSSDDDGGVGVVAPAAAPVAGPEAVPVITEGAPLAPADTSAAGIPIAAIMRDPAEWSGRTVSGQARVAEAVSDRGFWIESGGQRLFVVKNESPRPGVADVQGAADTMASRNLSAGQVVRMSGTVHTSADQVMPPIDDRTRQILAAERVFMISNVADVQHLPGRLTAADRMRVRRERALPAHEPKQGSEVTAWLRTIWTAWFPWPSCTILRSPMATPTSAGGAWCPPRGRRSDGWNSSWWTWTR